MKTLYLTGFIALLFTGCSNSQSPSEVYNKRVDESQQSNGAQEENESNTIKQELEPMEYVVLETSKGDITLELDPNKAPETVANFLSYVDAGHYDNTIFHRVISNFMVQGGGFLADGTQKPTQSPIQLESQNGLSNDVGTVAMARTNAPNSATAQFFINVAQNDFLNYKPGNPGYAVFGKITSGMDVVNDIRQVETRTFTGHGDWPVEAVTIKKARRE